MRIVEATHESINYNNKSHFLGAKVDNDERLEYNASDFSHLDRDSPSSDSDPPYKTFSLLILNTLMKINPQTFIPLAIPPPIFAQTNTSQVLGIKF